MNFINSITIPEQVTEVIKSYIQDFENSDRREEMDYGEDYYRSHNTEIMSRKMLIYAEDDNGVPYEIEDPYKANNKLPAGYFKLLVDQKVDYLLGKEVAFESEQADDLTELLGRRFQIILMRAGKEASKKVVSWIHPYIDADGKFQLMVIPSEQVIPIYDMYDREKLNIIIRYYAVKVLNEDNESVNVNRVEVWDDEQVTYYQENTETGLYDLLGESDMSNIFGRTYPNPKYHFSKDMRHGDKVTQTEGLAWGAVPFISLYNNDEEESDLNPVKAHIDAYDIVTSDFVNNLEDFQDVYWILKGYQGQNLQEFLTQVKRYKTLKVGEDGDARAETIQIPHEARKEARAALEKDIFNYGMGVNPNLTGDGNVTNVVLKSRFANLDLKASQFELELKDCIYTLIDFVNRYQELNSGTIIELDDVTFNRSMIMNEVELLEANANQRGNVSEDTRLSEHPWVSDIEAEKEAMDKEGEVNLDDFEGDDDEPEEES